MADPDLSDYLLAGVATAIPVWIALVKLPFAAGLNYREMIPAWIVETGLPRAGFVVIVFAIAIPVVDEFEPDTDRLTRFVLWFCVLGVATLVLATPVMVLASDAVLETMASNVVQAVVLVAIFAAAVALSARRDPHTLDLV